MNTIKVGNKIKILREEAALSAKNLANKVGIDPSQISKIEKGASNPSLDTLARICQALNISLSDFFAESDLELNHEQRQLLKHSKDLTEEQVQILNKFLSTFSKK